MAIHLIVIDPEGKPLSREKADVLWLFAHIRDLRGKTVGGTMQVSDIERPNQTLTAQHYRLLDENISIPYLTIFVKAPTEKDREKVRVLGVESGNFLKALIKTITPHEKGSMKKWKNEKGDIIFHYDAPLTVLNDIFVKAIRRDIQVVI